MAANTNILNWINDKGLAQGIFWIICASFFSNMCDTSIRLVGNSLPFMQVAFFRLFLGTLILLPLMIYKGKESFRVKNKSLHIFRVIIGFVAISCWVYGASQTSLPSITTMSFTCTILVLPLAYLFLGEKSDWRRILAVGVAFFGVIIIAFFETGVANGASNIGLFHPGVVFLFIASILFASSDVLNKKMLGTETLISLLFYFYFGSALISFIPALLVWKPIALKELSYLLLLGIGGVSILYCLLKAADSTEISSIAPYKYVELIFSIAIGYLVFKEVIKTSTVIGAALIIPSALAIGYCEIKKAKREKENRLAEVLVVEEE